MTVHAARAWSWYEVAQGGDPSGPLAGVPYDGKLTKADGRANGGRASIRRTSMPRTTQDRRDNPPAAYCEKFFNRTKHLIDDYKPDLLYFDDGVLPLDGSTGYGLSIAAHYYNASTQWHGSNEAVMNTKGLERSSSGKALVWDIERGQERPARAAIPGRPTPASAAGTTAAACSSITATRRPRR